MIISLKMGITYNKAIQIICGQAREDSNCFQTAGETVPLETAIGRITKYAYYSRECTPRWDTSAMDGYAFTRMQHAVRPRQPQ
jgi:molybdopterin molybdotransferase